MVELLAEPVERRPVISRDGQWVVPEAKLLDRQVVQPGSTGGTNLRLQWKDLVEGTNHATVRLSRPDPLESDNVMFVTVESKEQGRSLVVSDNSVDGQIVALMLNPLSDSPQTQSPQAQSSQTQSPQALGQQATGQQQGGGRHLAQQALKQCWGGFSHGQGNGAGVRREWPRPRRPVREWHPHEPSPAGPQGR